MSPRLKIILIIGAGVLLLTGIALILFWPSRSQSEQNAATTSARSFVTAFGSYTDPRSDSYIGSWSPYATATFTSNYKQNLAIAVSDPSIHLDTTTRVSTVVGSLKVVSIDSALTTATLSAGVTITTGSFKKTQTQTLILLKQNGKWLVNQVTVESEKAL